MEKRLKVFVYNEGDPPIFHFGPCKQTYAIEGYFIQAIEISHFRTNDPSKAHLFFLPISITMLTKVVYVPNSHQWTQMKNTASDYINVISHKYPYWNQTLGADHFMLACHDWVKSLITLYLSLIFIFYNFYFCFLLINRSHLKSINSF